ncbi:MAG: flagellar biosynthetic protein FliO [bacterium]|nr:flagellar biosynthetic protein FliO [bacterium]
MSIRIALVALTILCFVQPGMAQTSPVDTLANSAVLQQATSQLPNTYSLLARMGLSLLVVIALIWLATHLLKRFSGGRISSGASARIQVLERTYIAPKKAVYIVRIGSRALAVGVTDTQMNTLAELDPEEILSAEPAQNNNPTSSSFAHILKGMRTRLTGPSHGESV